jgi:polyhydroxybutyrate depolymerase
MKIRIAVALVLLSILSSQVVHAATVSFPGSRPFNVFVPSSYNKTDPVPLVIALSGYGQTGAQFEDYLHLTSIAQSADFIYVHPDGMIDSFGERFWNATPECCDFQKPPVNDAAYIMSIINKVSAKFSVDKNRIYIIGHSNGGFMANALACKYSSQIAAIINIAGGSFTSTASCKASSPISVLQIWGTKDDTYSINHIRGKPIPGAEQTFSNWGVIDQCSTPAIALPDKLDLDPTISGDETTVLQYQDCPASTAIDFWKMDGAGHSPVISKFFASEMIAWLMIHPKLASH